MIYEDILWIFKYVEAYYNNGRSLGVLMKQEEDSETWEHRGIIWKSDPVTLEKYAKNGISETY